MSSVAIVRRVTGRVTPLSTAKAAASEMDDSQSKIAKRAVQLETMSMQQVLDYARLRRNTSSREKFVAVRHCEAAGSIRPDGGTFSVFQTSNIAREAEREGRRNLCMTLIQPMHCMLMVPCRLTDAARSVSASQAPSRDGAS